MLQDPRPFEGDQIRLPGEREPAAPSPESEVTRERLEAFIGALEREIEHRIGRRQGVEQRWLLDLQQYHGVYPPGMLEDLAVKGLSTVFINLTAVKTEAMEARLFDLLHPTDERSWAVGPTPVPELSEEAEAALEEARKAKAAADEQQAAMQAAEAQGDMAAAQGFEQSMRAAEGIERDASARAEQLQGTMAEARKRARLMEERIADQLVECNFAREDREAIGYACKIGTGVMKGPVLNDRPRKRWRAGPEGYALGASPGNPPAAIAVNPWNFFPEPDASRVEDSRSNFERHFRTKAGLREMARIDGFDREQIRELLREGPSGDVPAYMPDLLSLTGQSDGSMKDQYQVWEYRGPIEPEDWAALAREKGNEAAEKWGEEIDPLTIIDAVIWFCQGRVLSFALNPMDSGESIYSAFTIRKDEGSPWGFGIPYIMRDPQAMLNGATRMMMDNAGLSTGPQVVVNREIITPQDGQYTLRPRKVWFLNTTALSGAPPFQTFNIESNQQELAAIIGLARETINEVTAMPEIMQGEPGSMPKNTATGMALLMSSANVVFRRIVRNHDDDITVPLLTRFYHWNMQFGDDEAVKGDYEVQARGASVLLTREMQAQNLLAAALQFGADPEYAGRLKKGELLKAIFRAFMIPAEEVLLTESEYEEAMAQAANEVPPEVQAAEIMREVEQMKLDMKRQEIEASTAVAEMETESRREVAQINREIALIQIGQKAVDAGLDREADVAKTNLKAGSDERRLAAEIHMAEKTGKSAGGSV